jgi:hypothetical protein
MATARGSIPFYRQISSLAPPSITGKVSTDVLGAPGFPHHDTRAGSHTSSELTQDAKEAKRRTQGIKPPCDYKRSLILAGTNGRKGEPPPWEHATAPRLCTLSASSLPVEQHEGPVPPTMQPAGQSLRVRKQHRHLRQCHVFSTAEPVPRLEAAPHVTQQCQLGAAITGQSVARG